MSTQVHIGDQVALPETFYVYTMIDSAADDINQHVAALKRDAIANRDAIRSTADGARWYSDFATFDNEWVDWYRANRYTTAGFIRDLTGTAVGAVRNFGARYNALESRYRELGFNPTSTGSPGDNPAFPTELTTAALVAAGLVALGLAGWLAYSASKFVPVIQPIAQRFSYQPSLRGHRIRR
jgi:hypothetical protein